MQFQTVLANDTKERAKEVGCEMDVFKYYKRSHWSSFINISNVIVPSLQAGHDSIIAKLQAKRL